MADKDIETVLGIVEPTIDELIVTQMPGERAAKMEDIQAVAAEVFGDDRVYAIDSLPEAIAKAGEIDDLQGGVPGSTGVVIFGSVVLAGMAQDVLGKDKLQ